VAGRSVARVVCCWPAAILVAINIGLLGEALGIDLGMVQLEKAVGDLSCDIKARTRVVIAQSSWRPTTIVISANY
jgi:hypothetical protein